MKRWICALLALCLALALGSALAAEKQYKTLKQGDKGQAVLELKQRMYELGYFSSNKFSNEFNGTTKERLMQLQTKNGLKADGIATPEVQALIFSDACLALSDPPKGPELPQTDADGFLPEGEAPYSFASREAGVWVYLSHNTRIEIKQYTGKSRWGANLWLEATVRLRDPGQLTSLLSSGKKPGLAMHLPAQIIAENGGPEPILAINDDYFGYRVKWIKAEKNVGVIVRNGKVLYDDPKRKGVKQFPPLDVLAVLEDGSMKAFENGEHTAQEYLDMGARQTYSFGPVLVRGGAISSSIDKWGTSAAPRVGIGITADGTIKVLDVLGRRTDAKGVSVAWTAQKMLEMGCVEALNLDGGNTTCLIFLGDMINRPVNTAKKDIRPVTGLIAILDEAP